MQLPIFPILEVFPRSARLIALSLAFSLLAALAMASTVAAPGSSAPASSVTAVTAVTDKVSSWPQWRGPSRDGRLDAGEWPEDLSGLELLWRVELGKGYPGPIVAADRVFVAGTHNSDTEVVRALDRRSGDELWRAAWPGEGSVPFFAAKNGDWIRSTPAWDGRTLYVGGMNEILVALDGETGEERWRVDFPARFGTKVPDFGFSSSPLIDGEHLYVQAANSLVKLDPATGETVWRSLVGDGDIMVSGAFSSPVLTELAGHRQLVVQTRLTLFGVEPSDGKVLWSVDVPNFRGMNILTPVVHGDAVFTSSYRNRSFLYRVKPTAAGFEVEEAWTHKVQAYMASPVLIDGHIYLHLGNGRLTNLELTTGQSGFTSEPIGKYWSMVANDGKILALDAGGELHLVRANPESFELLDSHEIANASTWGHLAVAGDELFIRELEAIAVYRWSADGASEAPSGVQTAP